MNKDLPSLFKEVKTFKKLIKRDKEILTDEERFNKYNVNYLAEIEQRLKHNECQLYVLRNTNLPLFFDSFVKEIATIWGTNQDDLDVQVEFSPCLYMHCTKKEFIRYFESDDNHLIFLTVIQRDSEDRAKRLVCLNAPLDLQLKQKNGIRLKNLVDVVHKDEADSTGNHGTVFQYNNYKNMIVHLPLCILTDIYSKYNNDLSRAVLMAMEKDLSKQEETEPNAE